MWLINTTTIKLEFIINPEKGSYAILSHTWGDEEIGFQEFQNLDRTSNKSGYLKILRTCEIARNYGLKYAWVDTCSIDKSSSAELSEAINSMFTWYKNSAVCLAYLEDLPDDVAFSEGLSQCRWLTRGWTLQELIAPRCVEFFDKAWTKRSTKEKSKTLLAKITRISEAILYNGECMAELPVAQRMSWISRRQTTRAEDIAYCMLGIFDINMPLLYGEGDKAFMRLQEEIAKQTPDLSLFAWTSSGPSNFKNSPHYHGLFAKSPREFANCNQLEFRHVVNLYNEFTITNRGLRMEATLAKALNFSSSELVLNLGVYHHSPGAEPKRNGDGWVGIFVRKSLQGYVRIWSHSLYMADEHSIRRCPRAMLSFCKTINPSDIERLRNQYARSVRIRGVDGERGDITIAKTYPEDLWDNHRQLFLDPGSGLNTYFQLKLRSDAYHRDFIAIIACSTMDSPTCAIWCGQTPGWSSVLHFLHQTKEITDFVCIDYLQRDLISKNDRGATTAQCHYIDDRAGWEIELEARLRVDTVERSEGFVVEVSRTILKYAGSDDPPIWY